MRILLSFLALTMLLLFSFWAIFHPWVSYRLSKVLTKLACLLGLILILSWWVLPAEANTNFVKEADQWVYQSEQVLPASDGNTWNITAFKQMDEGHKAFYLRLTAVSESPGEALFKAAETIQLDAAEPLVLTTDSGETLTATNVTRQQFIGALPEPDMGQYDMQPLLPQIKLAQSLQLTLPTKDKSYPVTIHVPSETVGDWLMVGSCDYIMCEPEMTDHS